ncbi:hypothetical protein [Streptomyces sp. NPDC060031]|uniref:hypothetical protein n=1 Tax=Streptomyces sp. NPDC060031 TaxID=3347043 RepID=UPI0036A54033
MGRGSQSWAPVEEQDLPARLAGEPTAGVAGNHGELNVFACPTDQGHPHRWSPNGGVPIALGSDPTGCAAARRHLNLDLRGR